MDLDLETLLETSENISWKLYFVAFQIVFRLFGPLKTDFHNFNYALPHKLLPWAWRVIYPRSL